MLKIENLSVHYGPAQALDGVTLDIAKGGTVALVGANGAGKSTLLKTIMGVLRPSAGQIYLEGEKITRLSSTRIVRKGVALSPEGRELFGELTVRENLCLGVANQRLERAELESRIATMLNYFPPLQNRLQQLAGTLSGGEQQMVAMGRALMSQPRLLLLDEPSLGLSPLITDQLFDIIRQVARGGTTILLVEQNAARALSASQKAYLLANGRIVDSGKSEDLLNDPQLRRTFLGAGSENNPDASRLGASGLTNIRLEKNRMDQSIFQPSFRDEDELAAHQLKGLQWTVKHAYEGSSFYRDHFDGAAIRPGDIRRLKDIEKLPFTTAEDLRDGYPFPLRAVPFEQIVRIHASSGTTGKRKVLCYTQKDVDDWAHFFARGYAMAGVTPLDRIQIAVGYGVWTAGLGFQLGCEKIGAMAVPVGPGNVDMQCQFLVDFQSTVFCSTASMALLMAEEVHHRGLAGKINVKKIIYGSERSSRGMRRKISELFGGAELFDIPGLTELYGPGTGMECSQHDCIHYWGDYYLLEIIDPDTLQPLPPGEWGEMVVTTLCKEAAPLIRYRTRDITRIIPERCPCGSILPRHSRIKGRTDDMFIFRGVNIYPSSIDDIVSHVPGLGSEYQVHLSRDEESGRDAMEVVVEKGKGVEKGRIPEITAELSHQIKKQLLVSTAIKVVDYGDLPRSERKSQRIFDKRIQDSIV
ncbi:MAG: ATP-binding cassette domain-containing protein [Deltaproteobacteria bacterium]|nr:ATP-binding cassette domain-containing protein [Deltaproteobacteria bacterium]